MEIVREEGIQIKTRKCTRVFDYCNGLARIEDENGKCGFIDTTGKEVIECKYDNAYDFYEGLARVALNGKYGFIDTTGKEIIECKYKRVSLFSEGLAKVKLNDKWGYIDKTGKEVTECKYDFASDFHEGLAAVQLNGKKKCINHEGNIVLELYYIDKISSNAINCPKSESIKIKMIADKIKRAERIEMYFDLIIDGNRVSFSTLEEREQFEKELFIEEEDFEKQYVLSKK